MNFPTCTVCQAEHSTCFEASICCLKVKPTPRPTRAKADGHDSRGRFVPAGWTIGRSNSKRGEL